MQLRQRLERHTQETSAVLWLATVITSFLLLSDARGGILARWSFEDAPSGNVVADSVGGFNGALSPTGAQLESGGKVGNCLSLQKEDSGYVSMGNVLGLTRGDFSIVLWVKTLPGDTSENTLPLGKHVAGSINGYFINLNNSGGLGEVGKAMFFAGNDMEVPISSSTVNDGNWHQIVAIYQAGGVTSLCVDGQPDGSSVPSVPMVPSEAPLLFGGFQYYWDFLPVYSGKIDEVQIYDFALTPAEVFALYQNPMAIIPDRPSCATELAGVNAQLTRLSESLGAEFGNGPLQIPGDTTAKRVENVVSAILSLNPGQRLAVFENLGGTKK